MLSINTRPAVGTKIAILMMYVVVLAVRSAQETNRRGTLRSLAEGPVDVGIQKNKWRLHMKIARCLTVLLALAMGANIATAATCRLDKIDGSGKLDLSQFHGQYVYVDFWASWCGPCKQSFPFMNIMKKQFESKGLTVVGVSVDKDVNDAREFLKEHPAQFVVAKDIEGKCAKEMVVKGMPSSYILGKNGEVLFTHKGFRPSDMEAITKKLHQLTAQ
jgi:cytochrome c biogenesis protein CcmG/thiol:disulfide interchange protein DsbE